MSAQRSLDPWGLGFGLAAVAFALAALFLWFPNDMRGGFTELSPGGDMAPGDAFFPTLLAYGMLVLGLVQIGTTLVAGRVEGGGRIGHGNLAFLAGFLVVFAVGLVLLAFSGPLLAKWLGAPPYRQLSDTVPWKWIGFVLGGFVLGYAPVVAVERRARVTSALVVLAALAILVLIFDGLLTDIRLPPNADV